MNLIELMQAELPFSLDELRTIVSTAPRRYKTYKIPKRQPNQFRTIAQPAPEVKIIQRWLISKFFCKLPIHKAATAYRYGLSIADHAAIHAKKRFLLKMDFEDFFHSISSKDIERHLIEIGGFSVGDAKTVSKLVTWLNKDTGKLCLSIGAPSSPILSNTLLYEFDKEMLSILKGRRIIYSRYADDLAFSTDRTGILGELPNQVEKICSELNYPQLRIKREKTAFVSTRYRRVLVGLVLTPSGKVSLGRDRKRQIRTDLYRFRNGALPSTDVPKLRGELAFAWSVEKTFVFTLARQLGTDVFGALGLPFGDRVVSSLNNFQE